MSESLILALDIGTMGGRASVLTADGREVAFAYREYPIATPRPGWAEQDGATWWAAARDAIREVLALGTIRAADIAGIVGCGQMHSVLLLDRSGAPIRPAILWLDQRSTAECTELARRVGAERLFRITGTPAANTFSAPKLMWLASQEPEVWTRAAHVVFSKDYVNWRLCGEIGTDRSMMSATLLCDIARGAWSDEVCRAADLPVDRLPKVFAATDVLGRVTPRAAAETGLAAGTPVFAGASDCACLLLGAGAAEPGDACIYTGTCSGIFVVRGEPTLDPLCRLEVQAHAVADRWILQGVVPTSGAVLRWFRDVCGAAPDAEFYRRLDGEAAGLPPGSDGLIVVPSFMGEREPAWDPDATGVVAGLTLSHTRAHLFRAIMEGAAYGLRENLAEVERLGIRPPEIRITGGGMRSRLWRQITADVTGTPLLLTPHAEGGVIGAMMLAAVGLGIYSDVPGAARALVQTSERIVPDPRTAEPYARYARLYRDIAGAVAGMRRARQR